MLFLPYFNASCVLVLQSSFFSCLLQHGATPEVLSYFLKDFMVCSALRWFGNSFHKEQPISHWCQLCLRSMETKRASYLLWWQPFRVPKCLLIQSVTDFHKAPSWSCSPQHSFCSTYLSSPTPSPHSTSSLAAVISKHLVKLWVCWAHHPKYFSVRRAVSHACAGKVW